MASINNFVTEINRQLALYANQTDETVQAIAKEVAEDGLRELKRRSPKKSGDYAKSWVIKKVGKKFVLHNSKHYRLTHLLEKSHALANGGRSRAQPHIKPTEIDMIKEFEEKLERGLGR